MRKSAYNVVMSNGHSHIHTHGHDHSHGHAHSHVNLRSGERHKGRLWASFAVLFVFMVVELVAGIVTGSLALLSDAGHMVTDVVGIGMALAAIQLASRPQQQAHHTYGVVRLEILAALANAVMLIGISGYVLYEAIHRINEPAEVMTNTVLVVAILGLVANIIAFMLLREGSKESLNVEGAYLEVLADTIGSVGVIIGAVVMLLTGWGWVDALVGLAISVWILPRALRLAREAIRILLESAPRGLNVDELSAALLATPGVVDLHDLHVWTLTSGMEAATVHLEITEDSDSQTVLSEAQEVFRGTYGIHHATIQIERSEDCGHPDW